MRPELAVPTPAHAAGRAIPAKGPAGLRPRSSAGLSTSLPTVVLALVLTVVLTLVPTLFALGFPQEAFPQDAAGQAANAPANVAPNAPPQNVRASSRQGLSRDVYPLTHLTEELFLLRVAGANTKPKGHVLLLHGLTWSSHLYDVDYQDYSLCDYLAHEGYAVWLLDFAGYGRSSIVSDGFDVDTRHAIQEVILAVNFIRVHEKVEKIDLMGLSWGTVVAGTFAAEHPDKVNRLVLYSPIFTGLGEGVVDSPFFYPSWQVAADEFQHDPVGNIDPDLHDMAAVNTFIADCWRHEKEMTPNGGRRDVHVSRETRLIPVDAIRAPTLVIYGELDTYVDAEAAACAVDVLPEGSKCVTFPESYVFVHLERLHYRSFRERLLGFLEDGRQ